MSCPYYRLTSCIYSLELNSIDSGVGTSHALQGPQIQVVGMALIIEFCDRNIPFLKVVF